VHPGLWQPPVLPRPGLGIDGARGQNSAGAVTRTGNFDCNQSHLTPCRGRCSARREEAGRDVTDAWIANEEGTELVRARDIAVATLDYDGNVTVRLAGADGAVVTLVAHRAHHEEHRPGDLHRQLIRVLAELSDAAGAFLVRAVHDETRGWQWVTEPL